ncbi:WXG100 family type VII secretion target [Kitasatospora sp. NPDC056138]|uniref:WXG100 family type VII secretion target n=1 Tax=Kitasatospora sp. NPDC056138 TaxID=3345724 RepID=UPI0035D66ADA
MSTRSSSHGSGSHGGSHGSSSHGSGHTTSPSPAPSHAPDHGHQPAPHPSGPTPPTGPVTGGQHGRPPADDGSGSGGHTPGGHTPGGHTPGSGSGQTPGHEPGSGGEPEGDDPSVGEPDEGWFKGFARKTGETVKEKGSEALGTFAVDKAKEAIFGKPDDGSEGAPEGSPGSGSESGSGSAGGSIGSVGAAMGGVVGAGVGAAVGRVGATTGAYPLAPGTPSPYGGAGLTSSGSSAYTWARNNYPAPAAELTPATHPSRDGLGGMLDEAVQYALEKSGLMDELEKVTGNLDELNAAAEEWQAQAKAVQYVAEQLRGNVVPLSAQWEGTASDAFGRHMGEVVEALDSTAEGMLQTAQIINSAAQECALAEGMIIEIISEAIEALIVSLAAEAVIAVLTAGIGLIADALISEAEIAVFVARVARVSTELAENLEKILKALKDLGSAVKAVRKVEDIKKAATELKNVKTAVQGLKDFEEGGEGLGKLGKDAWRNKSLDGVGDGLKDYATRKAVGYADGKVTDYAKDQFGQALGVDPDDVHTGEGLGPKVLGKRAGQAAWGAAKDALTDDVNKQAVMGEVTHDLGLESDPGPYRVDRSRIEQAFG